MIGCSSDPGPPLDRRAKIAGPMPTFALLVLPAANRVYGRTAVDLLRAELAVFGAAALSQAVAAIEVRPIGGVPHVTFHAPALPARGVKILSKPSSLHPPFGVAPHPLPPP